MPRGGRLVMTTANQALHVPLDGAGGGAPRDVACAVLSIADTGMGIDPRHQGNIFEPFFTTKPPDRGTGLGLSTAYGIIQQAGGQIEFDSTPGRGTTFRICLPAAAPAEGHDDGQPEAPVKHNV